MDQFWLTGVGILCTCGPVLVPESPSHLQALITHFSCRYSNIFCLPRTGAWSLILSVLVSRRNRSNMSIQWRNFQEKLSLISVKLRLVLVNNRLDLGVLIFYWETTAKIQTLYIEFTTCLIHLFCITKIEFGHGSEWLLILLVRKIGTQVIGKFTVETEKQMDPFLHINQTPTRFITCNILTWHN